MKSNIETYLRIKPNIINSTELIEYDIEDDNTLTINIPEEMRQGYVNNMSKYYSFKFNGIFLENTTQDEIFENIGTKVINNSIEGYNSTVFCYGQTGSGKTYTMCGSKNWKERGLIPRLIIDLFKATRNKTSTKFEIYISYLEIYNESAYDLLNKEHNETVLENWKKIIVYEDNTSNIMMKNLTMIKVDNEQQALDLLITGNYIRHISSTQMNMASSRSHAIFTIIIESEDSSSEISTVSKINLVDLAGSERMKSNLQSITSIETKYINLSLSFLEQVITALNDKNKGRTHIPYRNSLMTTILKDSLGGNCKTILIANVSSLLEYLDETLSTMRFAMRCAKIQNQVTKNEHMDLNVLVSKLQNENLFLKNQIEMLLKNNNNVNANIDMLNTNTDLNVSMKKNELNDLEKDECKIIISDYLNEKNNGGTIKAKNINQLYYIVDFLIDYINNKEKTYKEKMMEVLDQNKELIRIATEEDQKYQKLLEIIKKNGLEEYFKDIIQDNQNK